MLGKHRLLKTAGLLMAGALVFSACSSSKKSTTTAGSAAGNGVKCSGVTFGFFGALTGSSANLGINENDGEKLAINEFNAKNPGCQVQLKPFDSQGSPDQAPALAQQAVSDSSVVALIGPAFSGESKVADPIFDQGGLPLITVSATNPSLSTHGWKVFHRAVGNDDAQGPAAAKYMIDTLSSKKPAVLDDASEYGKGIADIVRTKLKDANISVVDSEEVDPNGTDFSSAVNKIKAAGADAVFYGGYYQAGGVLAKQLKDAGVNATFVGPDGVNDKGFVTAAGAAAEGAILLAPGTPPDKIQNGDAFKAAYKALNGQDIGLYSVEAYDATNALLQAVAAGNTTRDKINTYLSTVDYKGLSAEIKFDSKGELAVPAVISISKVVGGQITTQSTVTAG